MKVVDAGGGGQSGVNGTVGHVADAVKVIALVLTNIIDRGVA